MFDSGLVPYAEQVDIETIKTEFIHGEPITDIDLFLSRMEMAYVALLERGIRHGDLTVQSVIVNSNRPYLIDFAESRLLFDPRPDKRVEGDRHWITKTGKLLIERSRVYDLETE